MLATAAVAAAAREAGVPVRTLGTFELRNVTQPRELFDLELCARPAVVGVDPVCRMKVTHNSAAGSLRFGEQEFWFCSLDCAAVLTQNPDRYARPE